MIVSRPVVTAMSWLLLLNIFALYTLLTYLLFGLDMARLAVLAFAGASLIAALISLGWLLVQRIQANRRGPFDTFLLTPKALKKLEKFLLAQTGSTLAELARANPRYAYFLIKSFLEKKLTVASAADGTGKVMDEYDLISWQMSLGKVDAFDVIVKVYRELRFIDLLIGRYQPTQVLAEFRVTSPERKD